MGLGRRPQPTALKIYKGETHKDRINKREPRPKPVAPTAPTWIDAGARKVWKSLASKLDRIGILTEIDGEAFAALCQCYSRYLAAEKVVTEAGMTFTTPNGYVQQRPEVTIAQKYFDKARAMMQEFGMTPGSRSRLVVNTDTNDDFGDLL